MPPKLPVVELGYSARPFSAPWEPLPCHRRAEVRTVCALSMYRQVYDVCKRTDLHYAPKLSEKTGNRCLLKREDQQPIYSDSAVL